MHVILATGVPRWPEHRSGRLVQRGLISLCLAWPWLNSTTLKASDDEDRALQAMLHHGLIEPSLRYVRARRSLEPNPDAVAWWVMREMECHARAALQSFSTAAEHWEACHQLAEQFRPPPNESAAADTSARWPWIQWQLGRCQLLRAQSLLASQLANPLNSQVRDDALLVVREILADMDALQADLQRRQPLAARQGFGAGAEAPAEQLRNLSADALLLQCEALMIRAQLYPNASADRQAAFAEIKSKTQSLQTRFGDDWPSRPAILLAQLIANLELGDESALLRLEQIASRPGPSAVRSRAAATAAVALAHSGQLSRAASLLDLLQQLAAEDPSVAPHWLLTTIEVGLVEVQQLPQPAVTDRLNELSRQTSLLADRYGDYWRSRADALMVGAISSEQVQDVQLATQLLLAEVRQMMAAGQYADVVRKLTQARDAQLARSNLPQALDLAAKAATVLRQQHHWREAAEVLQPVAVQLPEFEPAAEAHLWVVRSYAEQLRLDATDVQVAEAYETSLLNQLRLWPLAAGTGQARQWFKNWCLARGQRQHYLQTLLPMLLATQDKALAAAWLDELFEQLMLLPADQRTETMESWLDTELLQATTPAAEATRQLLTVVTGLNELSFLSHWSESKAITDRRQRLESWLRESASQWPSLSPLVAATVTIDQLRLGQAAQPAVSLNELSEVGRSAVAPALVDALDACQPDDLHSALQRLDLEDSWRTHDQPGDSPLMAAARWRLASWLGDSRATDQLRRMAQQFPQQGAVQLLLAYQLLHDHSTAEGIPLATRLAAYSPSGSPLNLSARWCLMRMQIQAGRPSEAQSSARKLLVTIPGLSGWWSARFADLAERQF